MYWSLADARLAVNAMTKRKIRTPQKILDPWYDHLLPFEKLPAELNRYRLGS
jgi:hypothetical protein